MLIYKLNFCGRGPEHYTDPSIQGGKKKPGLFPVSSDWTGNLFF
jgi:hypothetical protein